MSQPLLSVRNLCIYFSSENNRWPVADHISFDLKKGKTLAIVGESGSGKTVLCRSLLGLLPERASVSPKSGIIYDGQNVLALSERQLNELRARTGMVFQDPMTSLNPVVTIGRQIAEALCIHRQMSPQTAFAEAEKMLSSLQVPQTEKRMKQYPHQLSGGLRQRAAMAMALVCEPLLLIADEPTTALDATVQVEILDLLLRQRAERGMALVLVTHDFGVAATMADQIAVMYAGKFVEYGPAGRILHHMRMPYTRALLSAVPRLEDPAHTLPAAIPGMPPDLANMPEGCSFAPRCDRASDRCRQKAPPLTGEPEDEIHHFACWNPIEGKAE